MVGVQLGGDADDETVRQISKLADSDVMFLDGRESNKGSNTTYLTVKVGVYGFLAIIGMVTLFYIINSISISVSVAVVPVSCSRCAPPCALLWRSQRTIILCL